MLLTPFATEQEKDLLKDEYKDMFYVLKHYLDFNRKRLRHLYEDIDLDDFITSISRGYNQFYALYLVHCCICMHHLEYNENNDTIGITDIGLTITRKVSKQPNNPYICISGTCGSQVNTL